MDQQQLQELTERLDRIEADVIEKLDKMGKNESWVKRYAAILTPIVSAIIVLGALAVAWGRIETSISNIYSNEARLQTEIDVETATVRAHHEDTGRHVDQAWKAEVKSDLSSIRNLLIEHMSDRPASKKGNQ